MPLSPIDTQLVDKWHASPNHNERGDGRRPDMLVLHYTGMNGHDSARDWLCNPASKVSCHYIVDTDGIITQMVPEQRRAWHAGVAIWQGETDINSCSIGIEIDNPGHVETGLEDYAGAQMEAVARLSLDICARHKIRKPRVLGHSDVAPARKNDPGEHFDWARLYRVGVGVWVPAAPLNTTGDSLSPGDEGPQVAALGEQLRAIGYGVPDASAGGTPHTYDTALTEIVTAFQRHWRQARVDGIADPSTRETIARVLAFSTSKTASPDAPSA